METISYHGPCNSVNLPLFKDPMHLLVEKEWDRLDRQHKTIAYKLDHLFDWEAFRPEIIKAVVKGRQLVKQQKARMRASPVDDWVNRSESATSAAEADLSIFACHSNRGRPSLDAVSMFKLIVFGCSQKVSDEELARATISDSLVRLFCRIDSKAGVARSTIQQYREYFTLAKIGDVFFEQALKNIKDDGLLQHIIEIAIDGSFVESEWRHVTKAEELLIKQGKTDDLWKDNPHRKQQIDHDATWTKKNDQTYFGYKIHPLVDLTRKVILNVFVSTASMHDSKAVKELITEDHKGCKFYADSAYVGPAVQSVLDQFGLTGCICEKGYRNRPLTQEQKESNTEKSRKRSRIEHVFGAIETVLKGSFIRYIGKKRAEAFCWFTAAIYNILRRGQLQANTG